MAPGAKRRLDAQAKLANSGAKRNPGRGESESGENVIGRPSRGVGFISSISMFCAARQLRSVFGRSWRYVC